MFLEASEKVQEKKKKKKKEKINYIMFFLSKHMGFNEVTYLIKYLCDQSGIRTVYF